MALLASIFSAPVLAQTAAAPKNSGTPQIAVPAARAAKNVAIITLKGEINGTVALSIKRRINEAVSGGADAIVFEIDSPGGELGAIYEICTEIKQCKVQNTVAWIHPRAFSGGAIVALACREIVVSEACSFGDAAPIEVAMMVQINNLKDTERAKLVAPLLAELVDSARLRGYDEKLVQGFAMLYVELWLVENISTGQRVFVDREEYRTIFGKEPVRSQPTLVGPGKGPGRQARKQSGGPPGNAAGSVPPGSPGASGTTPSPDTTQSVSPAPPQSAETRVPADPNANPREAFIPAAPGLTPDLIQDASLNLRTASTRPQFTPADQGQWKLVEYVSDGTGIFTLKGDQVQRYGLAQNGPGKGGTINDDEELKAFFGASNVSRLEPTAFELIAEFMGEGFRGLIIRGFLLVVFLVALFIEMTHPGLIAPGAIAAFALVLFLAPTLLMGLAVWWQIAAIIIGIGLLALEIFVLPGFGFFGVLGLVLLFAGLVGALAPSGGSSLFPDSPHGKSDLLYGSVTVLMSFFTALVIAFFIGKNLGSLPIINKLVLRDHPDDDESRSGMYAAMEDAPAPIEVGEEGVAITTLRPSGRIEIGERVVDVVAVGGVIAAGDRVRVTVVEGFRVEVERI